MSTGGRAKKVRRAAPETGGEALHPALRQFAPAGLKMPDLLPGGADPFGQFLLAQAILFP